MDTQMKIDGGDEWIVYRVWFPAPTESEPMRSAYMEVSAHPLRSTRTVKHQAWLLLSRMGYDVDPIRGQIAAIGTEIVTHGGSK